MTVSMIAAIGKNRELGKDNKIPWHIPEDFTWFKEKTQGHVVIMGRKTFESIGKPLPKRTNIIVTRDKNYTKEGTIIVHALGEALKEASVYCHLLSSQSLALWSHDLATLEPRPELDSGSKQEEMLKPVQHDTDCEVFIMGGAQIYHEGLQYADRLYITLIDHTFDADTFFPEYPEFTKVVFEKKGESGGYKYTFFILEKE